MRVMQSAPRVRRTQSRRLCRMRKWWGQSSLVYLGLTVATIAATAATLAQPQMGIGAIALLLAFSVMRNRPRLALLLWLLSLTMVPYWIGLNALGFVPASSAVGLIALLSLIGVRGVWAVNASDVVIALITLFAGVATLLADSNQGAWFGIVTHWLLSYLIGKVLCRAVGVAFATKAAAVVLTLVAGLTLFEFALSWHPFVNLANGTQSYSTWSPIQVRGGLDRSEWAFGHSIALGASLVAAVPLLFAATIPRFWKIVSVLVLTAATITTFSRAAMIALALSAALSVLFVSEARPAAKLALSAALSVVGVIAASATGAVFATAENELAGSSSWRYRLLDYFGELEVAGRYRGNEVGSVDNTFLALGLSYGWIVMLLSAAAVAWLVVRVLVRKASPAEVALVGQIPMWLTVAPITQYQSFVWFLAGLAVAAARPGTSSAPSSYVASGRERLMEVASPARPPI